MANIFRIILNALIFRFSFKVKTRLNHEATSEVILQRLKNDPSFMEPMFENNEFTFMHKFFLPKFYNYSFFIFEGKIIDKESSTEIQFKAVGWLFFVIFYYLVILVFLYNYFIGIDKFQNFPFRNPFFAFIPILFLYIYSLIKISEVKSLFKFLFLNKKKKQTENQG